MMIAGAGIAAVATIAATAAGIIVARLGAIRGSCE